MLGQAVAGGIQSDGLPARVLRPKTTLAPRFLVLSSTRNLALPGFYEQALLSAPTLTLISFAELDARNLSFRSPLGRIHDRCRACPGGTLRLFSVQGEWQPCCRAWDCASNKRWSYPNLTGAEGVMEGIIFRISDMHASSGSAVRAQELNEAFGRQLAKCCQVRQRSSSSRIES